MRTLGFTTGTLPPQAALPLPGGLAARARARSPHPRRSPRTAPHAAAPPPAGAPPPPPTRLLLRPPAQDPVGFTRSNRTNRSMDAISFIAFVFAAGFWCRGRSMVEAEGFHTPNLRWSCLPAFPPSDTHCAGLIFFCVLKSAHIWRWQMKIQTTNEPIGSCGINVGVEMVLMWFSPPSI